MAHDINNHSAIIMSRADFLLYEAENNRELSACIEDLNVVNDQIEKISKITGNILKHSKKLSQSFSEIDLVKLVENSCYMVEPLIKKRKVKLIKEIKLSSAQINGDPNQIEQMRSLTVRDAHLGGLTETLPDFQAKSDCSNNWCLLLAEECSRLLKDKIVFI